MKKISNVISLFDGMSCGQIALNRLGIEYDNYFASEVDKYAIEITKKNFPNTIHIGDVSKVRYKDGVLYTENGEYNIGEVDLVMGGSPCQNLSHAVINNIKHNQGLDGEKSSLFYEYLRILTETNPTYFLMENVSGMKKGDKEMISDALGTNALRINSNLFSAQDRDRYYWTNISVDMDIKDRKLNLIDIALPSNEVDDKYWYKQSFDYHGDDKKVQATLHINGHDILKRVNNLNNKSATLTCCRGGNLQKKVFQDDRCRKLTPLEYERLQTVPDNYSEGVSDSQRYNMLGNGWTVDVICHIFSNISKGYY